MCDVIDSMPLILSTDKVKNKPECSFTTRWRERTDCRVSPSLPSSSSFIHSCVDASALCFLFLEPGVCVCVWTPTFPPTRGRMCILPVRLSLTEATIRLVPQRMTCRSAHLWSCVFPFLTLNTPFRRVRSCWSAFTGFSVQTHTHKSPPTVIYSIHIYM